MGMDDRHTVLQAGCQRKALAMPRTARDERQALAVVLQMLVAGDAPEREGGGILRRSRSAAGRWESRLYWR